MAALVAEDFVNYVKTQKIEKFRKNIAKFIEEENIMDFITQCNENEIKQAAEWCRKENIYLIHKIFEKVEKPSSISFLKPRTHYDKFDQEQRNWLHIAVIYNRDVEILKFLIEEKGINIESEDDYAYTPLHYYCQKEEYNPTVIQLLIKNQDHLTRQSKDGLTPLEFACSSQDNLSIIQRLPFVDMKYLLRTIDNITMGIVEVEIYALTTSFSTDRIWLNLLQKNDKYMLLSYIMKDDNFMNKYYLEPSDIISIIKKCPENGQGILTYIKGRFFKEKQNTKVYSILAALTGIKIKESVKKRTFYKSALFLVLITGRFQLISPLLRCCQFDIMSYAVLICLVCKTLAIKARFPDQVVQDILEVKDFCEEYAIEVMYITYNKDLSDQKEVIGKYINKQLEKLDYKSIVEIAYHAKCQKYLSLPSCQESLTNVWMERSWKCPQIKFWLHSFTHLIFLVLFSFVIVNHLFVQVSAIECLCYAYGLGYLIEELRQIYLSIRNDFFDSYCVDAANIIDICGLLFLLLGFLLRVSLRFPEFPGSGDSKLFAESHDNSLFVLRLILCLSLISFFMRVLYFASINEILGPKLKMINTMIIQNLIPLLFIFNVFMISFGVTFQALLYPNSFYSKELIPGGNITFERKGIVATVGDIFRRATFTIFDFHYTLNDVESNPNLHIKGRYAVYFFLLVFMIVVNIMLINLLIALFSNTVTRIITESKLSWKSGRYGFIHEYWERTIAPPPFNIIVIIIEALTANIKNLLKSKQKKVNNVNNEEDTPLHLLPRDNETPEETSMCYFIYQAFAMSGQRYRLVKDIKDTEYEKEVHFRNIEERIKRDKGELKKALNEKCKNIENKLDLLLHKRVHQSISNTVSFT